MDKRVWDSFLTPRDREVFPAAGYGAEGEAGECPALLVVDVNYDFVGVEPEPVIESIKRFPNSCGLEAWAAMGRLLVVLDEARTRSVPVIYTTNDDDHSLLDHLTWGRKNHRIGDWAGEVGRNTIADLVAPQANDIVITKKKPSAFFGTPLLQYLVSLGIDQLLCCGATTSGCVRATVVDAFSFGFGTTVIEDCTFDRGEVSHAIALFDMHQKYADVVDAERVLSYLRDSRLRPARNSSAGIARQPTA